MNPQNIEILKDLFNWLSIPELSEPIIQKCAEKLNSQLPENFLFNCTRKLHKKCNMGNHRQKHNQ